MSCHPFLGQREMGGFHGTGHEGQIRYCPKKEGRCPLRHRTRLHCRVDRAWDAEEGGEGVTHKFRIIGAEGLLDVAGSQSACGFETKIAAARAWSRRGKRSPRRWGASGLGLRGRLCSGRRPIGKAGRRCWGRGRRTDREVRGQGREADARGGGRATGWLVIS